MKKKKILFINLIILFFVFVFSEITSCLILSNKYKNEIKVFTKIITGKEPNYPIIKYNKTTQFSEEMLNNLRPVEYRNSKKKPVVLFGCSYTEGFGLKENETFSRYLADYTDRTVYNRGLSGTGIPFMYYQLSEPNILKDLPSDAEYVIFTLIPDHFPRLFRYRNFVLSGDHTLRYKLKNGKLVRDTLKFPLIHSLYTSIIIEEYISQKNGFDTEKTDKLFYALISESYKLIKKKFPGAKFVILYYQCSLNNPDEYSEELDLIKKISDDIIVINARDLCPEFYSDDKSYWLEDNDHPSAKAWRTLIPRLCKKLNIT